MTVNTENNRLTASFGGARLIVEPWGESSVRVRMYPALCDIAEDERLSSSPYYSALTEQVSHNCTIRSEEVDTTDPWYKGRRVRSVPPDRHRLLSHQRKAHREAGQRGQNVIL